MQTQSIGNTYSDVRFKAKNDSRSSDMVAFVDLNDRQLRNLAYSMNRNNESSAKKSKNHYASTFLAMPIVDTLASGILVEKFSSVSKEHAELLRKAPLSTRTFCTAKTAANWGVGLGIIGLYNVAKKAITSQSTSANNFNQEHPIASFLTDMAVITAGFFVALKGMGKTASKYFAKNPNKAAKLEDNMTQMATKLDNSNFNKKVLPKIVEKAAKFAEKAPFLAKAGRFALANSVWIILGASLLHTDGPSRKEQAKAEETFQKLKLVQAKAREKIGYESDDEE